MPLARLPLAPRRIALVAMLALSSVGARAQGNAMDLPSIDAGTVIDDTRGAVVAPDLEFVDEMRQPVRFGQYLNNGRPVILNLGYYGCPGLCGAVVNGMVDALAGLELELGSDYEIVTVSIDPDEKPSLARAKKNSYQQVFTASGTEEYWHFLTGDAEQSAKLADTVGFRYQWNPHGKQWDHSAGIFVLSPDGTLSQVLQGASYSPRTLRLALVEASEGVIGTAWDRILLTCYGYDPHTGEYSLMVWTVIRIGGVLTVGGIAVMIFVLWRRERRKLVPAAS